MTDSTKPEQQEFDASPGDEIKLDRHEGWPDDAMHKYTAESIWAIRAALATGRPLLVRGEPGTGKSQLARAAATTLQRRFLFEVVNSRTEVTDLLYHFDAVARLAEAQILGAANVPEKEMRDKLTPGQFVRPGKVWWAINWKTATQKAPPSESASLDEQSQHAFENGCVLLIDEIDKAESELPNALLECFANQSFQVPYLDTPIKPHDAQRPPLVVVTTNEERELPPPFLRRCLVLNLKLDEDPDNEKVLIEFLTERGRVQFKEKYEGTADFETILHDSAKLVSDDRKGTGGNLTYRPGQAEYLDLCKAVFEIASKENGPPAADVLDKVKKFSLRKNVG